MESSKNTGVLLFSMRYHSLPRYHCKRLLYLTGWGQRANKSPSALQSAKSSIPWTARKAGQWAPFVHWQGFCFHQPLMNIALNKTHINHDIQKCIVGRSTYLILPLLIQKYLPNCDHIVWHD